MKTVLYILVCSFLLTSLHSEAQWNSYSQPEAFFPSNVLKKVGSRLWCGGNHGIYFSDDNGNSWTKSYNGPLCTSSSAFRKIYNSGSTIWVTMDDGFFATLLVTRDNGITWQEDTLSDHLYSRNYNGYYSISIIKDTFYAQTSQSGVPTIQHNWKKHVSDTIWHEYSGIEYQPGMISHPWACYPGNGIWFVDFGSNMYSTTDGQNFTLVNITPAMAVHYFTVYNNKVFVSGIESATSDSISSVSIDNGMTWNKITTFAPSTKITFLAANGTSILATDNLGRTHLSPDDGTNWTVQPSPNLNFTSVEQIGGQFLCTQFTKDSVYIWGSPSNIENTKYDNIILYPNPSHGVIHIDGIREGKASIYNILGEPVLSNIILQEGQNNIQTNDLSSGIYTILVESQKSILRKKIVIQQ
jgi:photosystem II stability/assembly factor-like uncharacterized protein